MVRSKSRISQLTARLFRSSIRPLVAALLAVTSFRSAVADWNDVPTGSMKPTILEGDRVFVNKLAYDLKVPFTEVHVAEWSSPARGDVVVFFSPADGKRLIKRVIGLPGDRLQMVGNHLYLNGEAVEHAGDVALVSNDYAAENPSGPALFRERMGDHMHPIAVQNWLYATRDFPELTVPPNQYFMMGDNRDDSLDSRWFGFVERQHIVGKAVAIALSVNPNDKYRPRWQRFLSPLP